MTDSQRKQQSLIFHSYANASEMEGSAAEHSYADPVLPSSINDQSLLPLFITILTHESCYSDISDHLNFNVHFFLLNGLMICCIG
jgi:hypothetical protein